VPFATNYLLLMFRWVLRGDEIFGCITCRLTCPFKFWPDAPDWFWFCSLTCDDKPHARVFPAMNPEGRRGNLPKGSDISAETRPGLRIGPGPNITENEQRIFDTKLFVLPFPTPCFLIYLIVADQTCSRNTANDSEWYTI
jgi:hypothetical protein